MPSLHSLVIFTLAAAAMNISPGPSNLYVMSRSLAQGARAGLVAALGLATGSLFHVTVTALGLSVVLRYSPALYAVVKLVGAAYLIFLGLRLLLSKGATFTAAASGNRRPHGRIFRESILVEMLNPKTALFFLAFLPQFADPGAGLAGTTAAAPGRHRHADGDPLRRLRRVRRRRRGQRAGAAAHSTAGCRNGCPDRYWSAWAPTSRRPRSLRGYRRSARNERLRRRRSFNQILSVKKRWTVEVL